MKTADDFRKAAIENNIHHWTMHDCSICRYECGYMFFQYEDAEVVYDSGCDCTRRNVKTPHTWEDVANQYNININNPGAIKEYNEYWRFDK
jgi:hypothetical protein